MLKPLITVIIPIYNAEQYLSKCVNSVLQQTYSHFEVILVNDGSTDSSPAIVDEFVLQDKRVHKIHKINDGVSRARNAGLDIAEGEYVCFIDADDWIASNFLETFVDLAIKNKADLVFSKAVLSKENIVHALPVHTAFISPAEATKIFLYAEVMIGCWNKLYKRSVIEEYKLRFLPQYYMGEGLNFITHFSQISKIIIMTDQPLYFYRRDNLESATTRLSVEKMKNALEAIENIRRNFIISSKEVTVSLNLHKWLTCLHTLSFMASTGNKNTHIAFYNICFSYVKQQAWHLLKVAEVTKRRRLLLLAFCLFPYGALWLLANRAYFTKHVKWLRQHNH